MYVSNILKLFQEVLDERLDLRVGAMLDEGWLYNEERLATST